MQQEQMRQEQIRQQQKQEQMRQEQIRQQQEQIRREQQKQEQMRQEQIRQQQKQEAARQEQLRQDQMRQEQQRREQQQKQEQMKEQLRQDQMRQEQQRREQQRQEQLLQQEKMKAETNPSDQQIVASDPTRPPTRPDQPQQGNGQGGQQPDVQAATMAWAQSHHAKSMAFANAAAKVQKTPSRNDLGNGPASNTNPGALVVANKSQKPTQYGPQSPFLVFINDPFLSLRPFSVYCYETYFVLCDTRKSSTPLVLEKSNGRAGAFIPYLPSHMETNATTSYQVSPLHPPVT